MVSNGSFARGFGVLDRSGRALISLGVSAASARGCDAHGCGIRRSVHPWAGASAWLRDEACFGRKDYVALSDRPPSVVAHEVVWDDIRNETFLVTGDAAGPEVEDYLIRHLSSPGFRPKISIQRVGRENHLNMVGRGFGITLTTDSTLGTVYATRRLA